MKVRNVIVLGILIVIFSTTASAQDKKVITKVVDQTAKTSENLQKLRQDSLHSWKFSGGVGLSSSITALYNWAAGGSNSAAFIGYGNIRAIYVQDRFAWETLLETEFGYTYLAKSRYDWRKSNDKILLNTKAGYDIGRNFFATFMASFRSQYAKGYDYPNDTTEKFISNWLSPSYTDISLGIDWKPNDIFSVYFSPAAGRITTCMDDALKKSYGVDSLKNFRSEFGAMFKGAVNYKYKDLKISSALTLFTPYNKHIGNMDVDWDMALSYQLMKVLNVSLGTSLKYYDAVKFDNGDGKIKQHIQFKTLLGIGIGYTF